MTRPQKGHHYLTVVLNLLTGAVVFVGEGKGTEALQSLDLATQLTSTPLLNVWLPGRLPEVG